MSDNTTALMSMKLPELKKLAAEAGVAGKANFIKADIFESDYSQATVITMYLLPQLNLKLRPKILDLKAGTRIVSHAFTMGDWEPDERAEVEGRTAMLWIVPAKVDGTWKMGQGELLLSQSFQMVTGTLKTGNKSIPYVAQENKIVMPAKFSPAQ